MFLDKKKMAIIMITAIFFVAIDRYLKFLVLAQDKPVNLIGNLLKFNFAPNPNIAFSLPLNGWFLNVIIIVLIIGLVGLFYSLLKKRELAEASIVFFVFWGAVSNLFDRLLYGYVVDYLDLKYFTVFNVADTMIVLGVFILAFLSWRPKSVS